MENKINVAELLKCCPSGMPLDCAMWDNLYFDRVEDDMIYCYYELDGYRNSTIFCKDGCYSAHKLSKCVIFPKGKTTWEGFEPPVKFKDGDIAATKSGLFVGIVKIENRKQSTYCSIGTNGFVIGADFGFERLANEKEKQKLFDAINENGYIWYPDTKCLVKKFIPKFKEGDTIRNKTDRWLSERTIKSYVEGIGYFTTINDWVRITDQDNWELVPNKFDITTLKPFESRVLVRDSIKEKWHPAIWGFYDDNSYNSYPYKLIGDMSLCCIPYEGNEHLLGKTDDCDDYFKTWES